MATATRTHHVCYLRLRSETTGEWLVHPRLRPKLVRDAINEGTTLTDIVSGILAERHGISYERTGRATVPRADDEVMNVRVPIKVWNAVRRAAGRAGRRDMDQVRFDLCDHYGLRLP